MKNAICTDLWAPNYRLDDPNDLTGPRTQWIQIFPRGTVNHPVYGELVFDQRFFQELKTNFDNNVRGIDLAMDKEHAPDGNTEAMAWFKEVEIRADGFWALVEWTTLGNQLVHIEKRYRYFSPEWGTEENRETGETWANVLFGGAATNRPFLKTLVPMAASENWWIRGEPTAEGSADTKRIHPPKGDKAMGASTTAIPPVPPAVKGLNMPCPKCGVQLADGSCSACGYSMKENEETPTPEVEAPKEAKAPKVEDKALRLSEIEKQNKALSDRLAKAEEQNKKMAEAIRLAEVNDQIRRWERHEVKRFAEDEAGNQVELGSVTRAISPKLAEMYRAFKLGETDHKLEDFISEGIENGFVELGEIGNGFDTAPVPNAEDTEIRRLKGETLPIVVEGTRHVRAAEAYAKANGLNTSDPSDMEKALIATEQGAAVLNGATPRSY